MNTPADTARGSSFAYWRLIGMFVALAALIAAFHGRSLTYGLFMDDHAHIRQLRDAEWSLRALTDACRLELNGGVIDLWWMPSCTLRFFRPVAFALMKLVYVLSEWRPTAQHAASLTWHFLASALLLLLLMRVGCRRPIAWIVAALFAIHPGHVATVQWIAAQSELMVATFILGALLCWAEFRGWPRSPEEGSRAASRAVRGRWGFASALLFFLALGCRENALVFPLVILLVEPALPRRKRAALVLYAALGFMVGAYIALRSFYLGGFALPPRPYIVPPSAPDFLSYVIDKACYYLLGEFLLAPCVPIGGLDYFRQRPIAFYGLTLLVLATLAVLVHRHRGSVAGLLAPAALFGFMFPLLPVFESPHHLYLPGIGWALFTGLLLQDLSGLGQRVREPTPRRKTWVAAGALAAGLVFSVTTYFFGMAFDTAQRVEDRVVEEIAGAPHPVADGDVLYVANLPMIAHYAQLAVEDRTGTRNLRVVPLTWSPRLLGVATPTELVWIDERSFEIRITEDRFFSGPSRLLIAQAAGGISPVRLNRPVRHADFTVEPIEGDETGIFALRFTFDHALAQTGIHLFWGSQTRWACQRLP